MTKEELIKTAIKYRKLAYAPYSNFKVGAAVEGASGRVYGGCNVENSSYGLTICAERAAVSRAIAEGETELKKIAVATSGENLSVPCGACTQVIMEFGKDAEVFCCNTKGDCKEYRASELMPYFDRGDAFKKNLFDLKKKKG